jgi:hypothetical protein
MHLLHRKVHASISPCDELAQVEGCLAIRYSFFSPLQFYLTPSSGTQETEIFPPHIPGAEGLKRYDSVLDRGVSGC